MYTPPAAESFKGDLTMIVSDNPNRSSSRWLQACVLLCAVAVFPLGVGSARNTNAETGQDYEAPDWNQNWHQWRGPQANGVAPEM